MRYVLMFFLLMFCGVAAATDILPFRDEAQEQQFRQLTAELRCPKCQNNSIADSNSMIATDMRQKVYELMQEGKSKQEVIDYMVARYGHFVTYDPPLTPLTVLLWVLPAAAIVAGGGVIYARTRRRVTQAKDDVLASPRGASRMSLWLFAPGVAVALGIAGWSYHQTGSYKNVRLWQAASGQADELLARALDPQAKPLDAEELTRLALGLRTRQQSEPDNVEGWMMLGRIGMALNNAGIAMDAWARAYALAPDNAEVVSGYAEVLIRSASPDDNREGEELLRQLLRDGHGDVRILGLYAFNAFEQQRYREAIAAWEMMLKLLPAGDQRRGVLERSIEQARRQSEEPR